MEKKIDFASYWRCSLGEVSRLALVGAFASGTPLSAAAMKNYPALAAVADNNGRLIPSIIAAMEAEGFGPNHPDPIIAGAFRVAQQGPIKKVSTNLAELAARKEWDAAVDFVEGKTRFIEDHTKLWKAFYEGQKSVVILGASMEFTPTMLAVMKEFVAQGLAPTPESLGLKGPEREQRISFSTAKQAAMFANVVGIACGLEATAAEVSVGLYVVKVQVPSDHPRFRAFHGRSPQEVVTDLVTTMGGKLLPAES